MTLSVNVKQEVMRLQKLIHLGTLLTRLCSLSSMLMRG